MSGVQIIAVVADDDGIRLDRWFKRHYPGLAHGRLSKLLRTGQVRVAGKRVQASQRLDAGVEIRVPPLDDDAVKPHKSTNRPAPKHSEDDLRLLKDMIIHQDKDLIVFNKLPGLAVQGGSGVTQHIDGLLEGLRDAQGVKPRLVHRIDKDTSGLLVVAKNAQAATKLTAAFRTRSAKKLYWALVVGKPDIAMGKIDAPLAKEADGDRERMEVNEEEGKKAVTLYAIKDHAAARVSWLALRPLTGRTHQLRAHCEAVGTPILGDGKYGGKEAHIQGSISRKLHLHARELDIPHPSGGRLHVVAPLPKHMSESWDFFGFDARDNTDPFEEEDMM